jgi:hypothetical protein
VLVLDDADRIWNRACDPFAEHSTVGDQALQDVLRVHGQVMNGGLASALEYNAPDEIHRAVAGFRYLRLDDVALTLATAFDVAFPASAIADADARGDHLDALGDDVHERLERLEDSYNAAVPRDAVLEAAFRERLHESPGDFAPLQ